MKTWPYISINRITKSINLALQVMILGWVVTQSSVLYASSAIGEPDLKMMVAAALGNRVFTVQADKYHSFSGSVEWNSDSNPWQGNSAIGGSDIYFGVLSPQRDKVWTWSLNDSGEASLNDGYVPIEANSTAGFFRPNGIPFSFSGNEPTGMYMVFILLVNPGENAAHHENWQHISLEPFFFFGE